MRDLLVAIVLLGAVIAGATFLAPRLNIQTRPTSVAAAAPVVESKHASAMRHPKTEATADRRRTVSAPAAFLPERPVTVETPVPVIKEEPAAPLKRALAAPGELRTGLNRAEIYRMFGDPDMRTTFLNKGTLFEKFIYVQKSEGRAVVATLRDGEVEQVWAGKSAIAVDIPDHKADQLQKVR